MGFLFLAIEIPKVITITFFLNMVSHLKFMVIVALTHLGLYKQPPPEEEDDYYSREQSNNYVLILDGSSPSLVPIPVHVVTASIKKRLPVLPYGDFLQGRRRIDEAAAAAAAEEEEKVCTMCLDCIERRHEIRELFNCSHVFHRDCLDTWVDHGHVTCPLCRSMLLPPKPNSTTSWCTAAAGGGG